MDLDTRKKTKYIVFQCTKCARYVYVRAQQKRKKCPGCKRGHMVEDLQGEIAIGVTEAFQTVQRLNQEALVQTQAKINFASPSFSQQSRFTSKAVKQVNHTKNAASTNRYQDFLEHLRRLQKTQYISEEQGIAVNFVEILLEPHGFSPDEIAGFIRKAIREGKALYISGTATIFAL